MGEIIELGDGVTYEMPVSEARQYRKVVSVIDFGNGVTYEVTDYVPVENDKHRQQAAWWWFWN